MRLGLWAEAAVVEVEACSEEAAVAVHAASAEVGAAAAV